MVKITLGELRRLITEASKAALDKVDALPSFDLPYGAKNVDYIDIMSIFQASMIVAAFPITAKQLKLAVKTSLPLSEIHPSQEFLIRDGLKRYVENPPSELPLVVRYTDGRYIAQDHTRIAAQALNGASMIKVRLIEYTGDRRELYRRPVLG